MFDKYFAAANGYTGFRSYFEQIFNPTDFDTIYILKGGPGTGKSSLMKKICKHFSGSNISCEEIYCSSDPNSLDGLIIMNNDVKIAVIDGTAPHETDAKFPGCIEELVNLGAAWDKSELKKQRSEIIELNKLKKEHYVNAYKFLYTAGEISKKRTAELEKAYGNDIEYISTYLSNILDKKSGRNTIKLLSVFGKNGYQTFFTADKSIKNIISVHGLFGSEYIFMKNLCNEIKARNIEYTIFPSPFSNDITEAVYIPKSETFINTYTDEDVSINTAEYINQELLKAKEDILVHYTAEMDFFLNHAKKEFENAAKCHFNLEGIYTPLMNFSVLDNIYENLIYEISKIIN